jgi:hypothetical protein
VRAPRWFPRAGEESADSVLELGKTLADALPAQVFHRHANAACVFLCGKLWSGSRAKICPTFSPAQPVDLIYAAQWW